MIRFMGCEIGKSSRQGDLRNFHGGRGLRCLRGGGCSPTQGFKTGTVMTLMTVMTNGDSYENLPLGFLMMDFFWEKLRPTRFNGWPLIKVRLHLVRWC